MAKIPSTKLVLVKKHASDTEGYIKVVVYEPGTAKPRYYSTGYRVPASAWDVSTEAVKRSHAESMTINREVAKDRDRVIAALEAVLAKGGAFTPEVIATALKPPQKISGDFSQFYLSHIRYLETRCTVAYCSHFYIEWKKLNAFQEGLCFSDITASLLERYEITLAKYAGTTKVNKMKRLKEVIDKAIEYGHIERKAVAGYKWPTYDAPVRPYLTLAELSRIEEAVYSKALDYDPVLLQTACYFLVECYSGIRFSDWSGYEVEQIIHNRSLKVGSTQKNKQPVYLPLKDFKSLGRIITFITKRGIRLTESLNTVNRQLKILAAMVGIKKHLTTHIGRHTFGTICGEKGFSIAWIAQAMAISEQTAKTYVKSTRQGLADEIKRVGGW